MGIFDDLKAKTASAAQKPAAQTAQVPDKKKENGPGAGASKTRKPKPPVQKATKSTRTVSKPITQKDAQRAPWLAALVEKAAEIQPYKPQRINGQQWAPGSSGNPGGRPRSIIQLIDLLSANGEEMIVFAFLIMRGELQVVETKTDRDGNEYQITVSPSITERLAAHKWLSDRKWGKAPDVVKIEAQTASSEREVDPAQLGADELRGLFRATQKFAQLEASNTVDAEIIEGGVKTASDPNDPGKSQS